MKKLILVTGSSGFIGFHLCNRLLNSGEYEIIGIDLETEYGERKLKEDRRKILEENPGFTFLKGDIEDAEFIREVFQKYTFSAVFHLAAKVGVRNSENDIRGYIDTNILGFYNVIDSAQKAGIGKFIYASSSSVYGDSQEFGITHSTSRQASFYSMTKKTDELMAYTYYNMFGFRSIGLRFFTVYGPYGRPDMIPILFSKKISSGEPIDVFNKGELKRDFTYIDDIIDGLVGCLQADVQYEIFNLGTGKSFSVGEFISKLEIYLGKKAIIEYKEKQKGDVPFTQADNEYSRNKIGYSPKVGLDEGLKKFIEWFKNYY